MTVSGFSITTNDKGAGNGFPGFSGDRNSSLSEEALTEISKKNILDCVFCWTGVHIYTRDRGEETDHESK